MSVPTRSFATGQLLSRSALFGALLGLALALFLAAPVTAEHTDGHEPPGRGSSPDVTEDHDSDEVANAPDPEGDADNRHPSGKDKHVEAGKSLNQGRSSAEPDANGRGPERDQGGTDQPDGPGGADILDQDRNNGCGNDDDFDDDNEGRCGQSVPGAAEETPPASEETPPASEETPPAPKDDVTPSPQPPAPAVEVLPVAVQRARPEAAVLPAGEVAAPPSVAGAPEELAATGAGAQLLAAVALALAGSGIFLVHASRRGRRRMR